MPSLLRLGGLQRSFLRQSPPFEGELAMIDPPNSKNGFVNVRGVRARSTSH